MALTLSACATSGAKFAKPHYPELPADLRVCFETQVAPPSSGVMTKKRVIFLIAELKKSETEKNDCGKRLIAFYDNVSH
ncbi:hypothetical protein NKG95_28935 [Mesorhizobium sp. M1423]|uniref:hypothetical protein n=1 Tax=unclassified Mesorhizobium TaxID=325217 RepID=UPI00333C11F0